MLAAYKRRAFDTHPDRGGTSDLVHEANAARDLLLAEIARVRMPVGVDVGARTPAEIGVAIAAELIAWRSGRDRARWSLPGAAAAPGESPVVATEKALP
mgnify:CR=1 FL=1